MAEKTAQLNKNTEKDTKAPAQLVKAHARSLRIAPRKMRLVTNLVKDMRLNDALTQLQFTNKKGAKMLQKLLQSAAANAEHNFSLNRDGLFIKTITCDMGTVMKRSFPRARGSAFMIRHKLSHVNVVLEERTVKAKKKRSNPTIPKAVKPEQKEKFVEATSPIDPVTSEVETPVTEAVEMKETHNENDRDIVEEKKSPENLRK
jgi:large subunit ribosomal protein L22